MAMSLAPAPAHVPAHLVRHFDFRNDEALRGDPWAYLSTLEDLPDIFFSPDLGGYWVVTRKEMIDDVFARHDLFSATSIAIPKIENPFVLIPNGLDPPAHTGYRKVLANNLFSPRALKTLVPDSQTLSRQLFDGFAPGRCEFVKEFAYRLPIDIFLIMMGADPAYRDDCLKWVRLIFRGRNVEETRAGFAGAATWATEWLGAQLAAPERNTGGMFQAMVASRIDGRALTFAEMHSITLMLFLGGLDTITSQMTHIMRFLAESPDDRQYLLDHPDELPLALEEMLRRFGISFIGRAAASDFEYHGVHFKRGDAVCAATPIAGLDPRAFPDPLRVDFQRGKGGRVKHLGFGSGPHICVGAHLARTQLTVMLEELLPRMPGLRIAPGTTLEYISGATMMLKALPLSWDA